MRSSTNSEGSRLVRIVVLYAQTRVAIARRILERTVQSTVCFERPAQQATSLERSKRRDLFFVIA